MAHDAALPSDPRRIAVEVLQQVLARDSVSDSSAHLNTLMLRRRDGAPATAFLISLRSEPARLLVPLRAGRNIVARSETIGDHHLSLTEALATTPKHSWPQHWCEAGQCHIICEPPNLARVADRSSARTSLYRSSSAPEGLPKPVEPSGSNSAFIYRSWGDSQPGVEPVTGKWAGDSSDWSPLFEGDVLVCLTSLWVFTWVPLPHRV
jgi:hypothetical protein